MMTRFLPLLALSATLAACAGKPGADAPPATVQRIDNADQYGDVIARLERGEVRQARKSLEAMVKREPSDQRAATLLRTITEDPQALLGAASFSYQVKAGETLPVLSSRFLGNRDRFYALARYNGIDDPRTLAAGQMLRIPGEEARAEAPAPRKPRPAVAAPAAKPKPLASAKPKPAAPAARPAANPMRAAQLRAGGLAALNRGQVDRAVVLLAQAASANPGNAAIRTDLARAQRIRATVKARR